MPNVFKPRKYEDIEIVDGDSGNKVGEIRIKPSGVLWAPTGSHKWFRVDLETFAAYMEKEGTEQDK